MGNGKIPVILLLILFSTLYPSPIERAENLLAENKYTELEKMLPELKKQYPDHPAVWYISGVLETDAEMAFYYYHKVANMPESDFADDSVFRMAQYYYSKQNYKLAKQYFQLVPEHFPASLLTDDALYMICQNYLAMGKVDSAQIFYRTFIEKAPRSSYVDYAVMDLDFIEGLQHENEAAMPLGVRHYCIQVGAFRKKQNARTRLHTLNLDVESEIIDKVIDGKKLYIVLVGKFQTRSIAENFAERVIAENVDDYRIVQRIKL